MPARPIAASCETDDPVALKRFQQEHAQRYIERGEIGAADIALHLLDPDWLLCAHLILIGSRPTRWRRS